MTSAATGPAGRQGAGRGMQQAYQRGSTATGGGMTGMYETVAQQQIAGGMMMQPMRAGMESRGGMTSAEMARREATAHYQVIELE